VVADVDEDGDTKADERTVVESEGKEVDGRAIIHGARGNVEREASDLFREENAEVITKISADEAKTDVSAKNKSAADGKNDTSDDVDDEFDGLTVVNRLQHVLDGSEARLVGDHLIVEIVTSETNDEDDDAIHNASSQVVATEQTSQELSLVLRACNNVPHERVEEHMGQDEVHTRVLQVHTLLDLLKVHDFTELTNSFHYNAFSTVVLILLKELVLIF